MNTNKRVLILTANYGNGHVQVAKTLYEQCVRLGFQHVTVSNLYQESNPIVSEVTQYLYLKASQSGNSFIVCFITELTKSIINVNLIFTLKWVINDWANLSRNISPILLLIHFR